MSRFYEGQIWQSGVGTGDEIECIGPSLGQSPRQERKKVDKQPVTNGANRQNGTVTRWNADRKFGFIKPSDGSADIFVHLSQLRRLGIESLRRGERLTYKVQIGRDGKPEAVNIDRVLE
jgi:CspA family cold shock protein